MDWKIDRTSLYPRLKYTCHQGGLRGEVLGSSAVTCDTVECAVYRGEVRLAKSDAMGVGRAKKWVEAHLVELAGKALIEISATIPRPCAMVA